MGPYPRGGRGISQSQGIVETKGGGWLPVNGCAVEVIQVLAQQIQRDVLQTTARRWRVVSKAGVEEGEGSEHKGIDNRV